MRALSLTLLALSLLVLGACQTKTARIMIDDDPTLVDLDRGGIETYDLLVSKVVGQLLEEHAWFRNVDEIWVAFVGIENRSSEELGEFREAVYENIDTALVNSRLYRNISRRFIDTALREINARGPEDIFLASGRQKFMGVLQAQGVTPDFLLFAKVTTKTSRAGDEKQRNYQLTLEMVDSQSGETVTKKTADVRKYYED
ncbi:MAG: hypothetical protein IH905_03135 [Proteobacteria bacterium]|nr:hypothetical protein [Pseudomonadota bacterium]